MTETDFRHFDSALGRFNVIDPLAEKAYDFTPYRYAFNNPVFWSDASGLFETERQAKEYAAQKGIKESEYSIFYNFDKKGYSLYVIGGEFSGQIFYDYKPLLKNPLGTNKGGGNSNNKAKLESQWSKLYTKTGFRSAAENLKKWDFDLSNGFGVFQIWGAKGSKESMAMETKKRIEGRVEYINYNDIGLAGAGGATLKGGSLIFEVFNAIQIGTSSLSWGTSILEDPNVNNGIEYIEKTLYHQAYEKKKVLLTPKQVELLNDYSEQGYKFRDSLLNNGYYNTYTP